MFQQLSALASNIIPASAPPVRFNMTQSSADLFQGARSRNVSVNTSVDVMLAREPERERAQRNQQILKTLDPVLQEKEFDSAAYILSYLEKTAGNHLSDDAIDELMAQQSETLDAVMTELSSKIIDSYEDVVKGISQIQHLGSDMQTAVDLSRKTRSTLSVIESGPMKDYARILTQYRKQQILNKIIEELEVIQLAHSIEVRIGEEMSAGNYEQAITLIQSFQSSLEILDKYQATKSISNKLNETNSMIENSLREALARICRIFDKSNYEKIFHSYKALNLLPEFVRTVQQLALEVVEKVAHESVYYFVLNTAQTPEDAEALKRLPFESLCPNIPLSTFTRCFLQLLGAFLDLMHSYNSILDWHKTHETEEQTELQIHDLIRTSIPLIWDDMQRKISSMLTKAQHRVRSIQVEEYLQIFNGINLFIEFGKEFSGSSVPLLSSTYSHTKDYFDSFHKQNIELIRTLLDNELWHRCPVPLNYSYKDIPEIASFLSQKTVEAAEEDAQKPSMFSQYEITGNPFLKRKKPGQKQSTDESSGKSELLLSSDGNGPQSISPAKEKKASVEFSSNGRYITSTANTFAKIIGRYLQMMKTFPHISHDIANGITSLAYLFGYSIYSVFVPISETPGPVISVPLASSLQYIHEQLATQPWWKPLEVKSGILDEESERLPKQMQINSKPTPLSPTSNQSILERISGAESLPFILEILEESRRSIEDLLPISKLTSSGMFYKNINTLYGGLREHIYRIIAYQLINLDNYTNLIPSCKWDIEEFDNTNAYVGNMVQEFRVYHQRIVSDFSPHVPKEVFNSLWIAAIEDVMETFVEGFSKIKKCTNAGQSSMKNDYQAFFQQLEKISGIKNTRIKFIADYVAAFFHNEKDFVDWVRSHPYYTHKQLTSMALLGCGSTMQSRAKSDFLDNIKRANPNPPPERKYNLSNRFFGTTKNLFKR